MQRKPPGAILARPGARNPLRGATLLATLALLASACSDDPPNAESTTPVPDTLPTSAPEACGPFGLVPGQPCPETPRDDWSVECPDGFLHLPQPGSSPGPSLHPFTCVPPPIADDQPPWEAFLHGRPVDDCPGGHADDPDSVFAPTTGVCLPAFMAHENDLEQTASCTDGDQAWWPGRDACAPVGSPCPTDERPWPPEDRIPLPADGGLVLHVDATTGDDLNPGGPRSPLQTLTRAVAASTPGSIIVLGAGHHEGPVEIPHDLTLLGHCTARTHLRTPLEDDPVLTLRDGASVTVQDLAIEGTLTRLPPDGTTVTLNGVRLRSSARLLLDAEAGHIVLEDVSVEATDGDGDPHVALRVQGTARLDAAGLDLATERGGIAIGGRATAQLHRIRIRRTDGAPRSADGIRLAGEARTTLTSTVIGPGFHSELVAFGQSETHLEDVALLGLDSAYQPTDPNPSAGILALEDATLRAERLFLRDHGNGSLEALDRSRLDLHDLVARHPAHPANLDEGALLWNVDDARVAITRGILSDSPGLGIVATDHSRLTLHTVLVANITHGPEDALGNALELLHFTRTELEDVVILRAQGAGIIAFYFAELDARSLVIAELRSERDWPLGNGIHTGDHARVRIHDATITHLTGAGIVLGGQVAQDIEQVRIQHFGLHPFTDFTLAGIVLTDSASLRANQVLIADGHGHGIGVFTSHWLELRNSAILRISAPPNLPENAGGGIFAVNHTSGAPSMNIHHTLIDRIEGTGVLSYFVRTAILDSLIRNISAAPCSDEYGLCSGIGALLSIDYSAQLERVTIMNSEQINLALVQNAEWSDDDERIVQILRDLNTGASHLALLQSRVGLSVNSEGLDLTTWLNRILFLDNLLDVADQRLSVPDPGEFLLFP